MKKAKFKVNKYLQIALGIFITVMLFILGSSNAGPEGIVGATAAAAITLTDEEKKDLSDQEQKFLLAQKKSVIQLVTDMKKDLMSKEDLALHLKEFKEGLTKEELKKLEDSLKEQGKVLKALQEADGFDEILSFEKAYEDSLVDIKRIREGGTGHKTFYFGDYDPNKKKSDDPSDKESKKSNYVTGIKSLFRMKVAGVTSVANSTASSPSSVTNPYSPFPTQLQEVVEVRRNPNFILNHVDVGTTNSAVLTWTEEGNSEGDAAVTAEGAVKPLQDKKFVDRLSKAKKVAGHFVITEEMEEDTPRIATAVRRLFQENVMRKYDDQVYTDLLAVAPGYTLTSLDDQIDNADDYAAIGAAIAQLELLNFNADLIAINPADKWRMRLQKGSDGHYVAPPFTVGQTTYDGIRVVTSNKVAAGNFLVGESKTYKVDEYKAFSIRVGWQNDDLVRNQMTVVGEVRFHSYIATNHLGAWCYAAFATVKAQIEKP